MQQTSFDFSGTAEDFSWAEQRAAEQRQRNERARRDRERAAEAEAERLRAEEFASNERQRKDARDREERERRQREQDQQQQDWFNRNRRRPRCADPWGALGLTPSASQAEIKSAWRRLVKQHHPDTGGNAEAFRAVQAAYERLRQGK